MCYMTCIDKYILYPFTVDVATKDITEDGGGLH